MKLHEKIKQLRLKHNLTQEELSKQLFVSRSLVAKWESGKVYPTSETIEKIAAYFNIEQKEILDDDMTKDMAITSHNKLVKTQFSFRLMSVTFIILIVALLGIIVINLLKPNVVAKFVSNQGDITIEVIQNKEDTTYLTYFDHDHVGTHTIMHSTFKDLAFSPDDRYMVVSSIYENRTYLEATDYKTNSGMNLDAHMHITMRIHEAFNHLDDDYINDTQFDFIGFSNHENLLLIEFDQTELGIKGYFWFDFGETMFSQERIKGVIFL